MSMTLVQIVMSQPICRNLEVRLYANGYLVGVVNNKTYAQLLAQMEFWASRQNKPGVLVAVLWDLRKNKERSRLIGFPERRNDA